MATYDVIQIYGPGQPGTTDTLLATVTTGKKWQVTEIHITNTDTVERSITIGLDCGGALANANHFLSGVKLSPKGSPGSVYDWEGKAVLNAAETIRALQDSATACTVFISGVEVTP